MLSPRLYCAAPRCPPPPRAPLTQRSGGCKIRTTSSGAKHAEADIYNILGGQARGGRRRKAKQAQQKCTAHNLCSLTLPRFPAGRRTCFEGDDKPWGYSISTIIGYDSIIQLYKGSAAQALLSMQHMRPNIISGLQGSTSNSNISIK